MRVRYRDEEWLRRMYHGQELTQREIAEKCDVSPRTIRKYVDEFGIEARELVGENHPLYGQERSERTKQKISESLEGRSFSEETLRRMSESHLGNRISDDVKRKISDSLEGITRSESTRKKMSESTKGVDNPNWNGGAWTKSRYADENWRAARRKVKQRDDICVHCGHDGSERLLDVHHIVPMRFFESSDRIATDEAHSTGNLILLCRSCHRKAEIGEIAISPDFGAIAGDVLVDVLVLWLKFQSEVRA